MTVGSQFKALQASIGWGLGCATSVRASSEQDGRPAMGLCGDSKQCYTVPCLKCMVVGERHLLSLKSQPTFLFSYFLSTSLSTQ